MRQALLSGQSEVANSNKRSDGWALLPRLCCQAAGGDPSWADDLAVAWFLFYAAANLMDNVQDQDQPDPWWAGCGPGYALSAASGLFFTASVAVNKLHDLEVVRDSAADLIEDFYEGFLTMCSGQHRDLIYPEPSLDQFWEIAADKSGSFFSMACRAGACLAISDVNRLDGFRRYGHHLGILIQILDDLEEVKSLQDHRSSGHWAEVRRSLPVIYAMDVYPKSIRDRLRDCLSMAHESSEAAEEALELVTKSGAVLFIQTEIEHHGFEARSGLIQAAPLSPAGELLNSFLSHLVLS
jgi:geranylgeranyl diphosphate synthase type I